MKMHHKSERNNSNLEGRKEMVYLTTHSTHFIYGYMASDIWSDSILEYWEVTYYVITETDRQTDRQTDSQLTWSSTRARRSSRWEEHSRWMVARSRDGSRMQSASTLEFSGTFYNTKQANVLFNDTRNTFYIYSYMALDIWQRTRKCFI